MTNALIRLFVQDSEDVKNPAVHTRYGKLAGWVGIVCNLLLALAKFLAGLVSGSIAIMADAVNNLSDAFSSVVTLVGFKLSEKPADKEHPFGHARFEYIAGLTVAVVVLVIGVELGRSSIDKILAPQPVEYGIASLLVLAVSIALKLWMAAFNRTVGRKIGSLALQATFADSRNDVIATSAVLVAAVVARVTGLDLDGWMGAAVAVFILISGIGLVRDTLNPLLGSAPDPDFVRHVDEKIRSYPGVLGTHDLIVHDYGPARRFASAHVEMDSAEDVMESHEVIDSIERDFLLQDNLHLIIHYDPIAFSGSPAAEARSWVARRVKRVDENLTIHDFRLVDDGDHMHYVFDVVVPEGCKLADDELRQKIELAIQRGNRPIHAEMTLDHSYAPIPSTSEWVDGEAAPE